MHYHSHRVTMSREAFMKLSDYPDRLGGIVDCVHHIGGSKFDRTVPDTAAGFHQVRTEYKRFILYKTFDNKEVKALGQVLTLMEHHYQRVDGQWQLAGTRLGSRMNEFNLERIFLEKKGSKAKI
ncbi:hypothetical protein K504DRAFT_536816 [Pleomassaria siparia CBS 279.74]|uniref:Scytalone dehydratase-like domain-containing protein n=1 Tax=Pleomassaria siparia CBS 279.74 TaxID=1314801 RepID=A0A6G1JZS5_9PLEO|nr:hypothetical protein K504DRAFT_536816 [Pleomassaria siparia CBS 279.74]